LIKEIFFLLKNSRIYFSNKGFSNLLLSIMIGVVVILVGIIFIASQTDLFSSNFSIWLKSTGGFFGSTND